VQHVGIHLQRSGNFAYRTRQPLTQFSFGC
jgi:hypothetical protein